MLNLRKPSTYLSQNGYGLTGYADDGAYCTRSGIILMIMIMIYGRYNLFALVLCFVCLLICINDYVHFCSRGVCVGGGRAG